MADEFNSNSKSIRQKNGEFVMQTLREINEPATITNIIKFIAETQEVPPGQIKESVKKILEKGVEYGFLVKSGAKYAIGVNDGASGDEPEERTTRQRQSRSRSGSRNRSRSRKRSRSQRRKSSSRRRKSTSRRRKSPSRKSRGRQH